MKVIIDAAGVSIAEADVFTALSVESSLGASMLAAAVTSSNLGVMDDDGKHVWLEPAVLGDLAGRREHEWVSAYGAMIAYARDKGWADEQGRVRAHIEPRD